MLKWLEGFGVNAGFVLIGLGVGLIFFILSTIDLGLNRTLGFMVLTSPIWLPLVLFFLFFESWLEYVHKKFVISNGRITLEIKFPQEVFKSPLAMELVLTQLYQTASPDNHFDTYLGGKHPPRFGLEIVSDGGRIHFYISAPKKFRNLIEAQLYAQYPGIEITLLDIDYTAKIPWNPDRYSVFGIHVGLKKPDPLPIKTYIDYGLDEDPKEEYKIDPMTPMLETLGSISPREQLWVQILITANTEKNFKSGSLRKIPDWKDEVKEMINDVAGRNKDDGEQTLERLTPGEKDTIIALERSLSKYAFNTAIRILYIAENDAFNPDRIGASIGMWKSFDDINRNQIGFQWRTDYDWKMWQDPTGKKRLAHKKRELDEYKRRVYNNQTSKDGTKVMTVEELATVFHVPGKVVLTPTLGRIPSTRSQAPINLPRASDT